MDDQREKLEAQIAEQMEACHVTRTFSSSFSCCCCCCCFDHASLASQAALSQRIDFEKREAKRDAADRKRREEEKTKEIEELKNTQARARACTPAAARPRTSFPAPSPRC